MEVPEQYKPPVAAIISIILAILLTLYQVPYLMDLKPQEKASDNVLFNLGIRLFAWLITGVLVTVLMYGKGNRGAGRDPKTRSIGLALTVANLLIWAGITYWYFAFIHGVTYK
jgi:hypothetical protein